MWIEENNQLIKEFKFKDFVEAFSFMTQIAFEAEKANHHPTWQNTYNTVKIILTTHDAGSMVTRKDKELASKIDAIFIKFEE